MSTHRLEPAVLSDSSQLPNPADADAALIARLAKELYHEFNRVAPALEAAQARNDHGLAGAYPAGTAPYAPPVHPPSETLASSQGKTASGAAGAENAHPFGEPRCIARSQHQPKVPVAASPLAAPVGAESFFTPAYYFVREPVPPVGSLPASLGPGAVPTASVFDVESVRRDFPALHQNVNGRPLVWLDNAATTHKPRAVIDATSQFYSRDNSNIHRAAHTLAARATELYEGGREKVRRFLGAGDAREIVFSRGTTEAINLVAQTYGKKFIGEGDEIILTTLEHHANIVPWQLLAEQTGAVIRVVPINEKGELLLDQFAALLTSRTKLVSVVHVANALGTINPIELIIQLAHAHGVPVLVDAAQSTPHLPVNVQALDVDFLVFSGHKIFGPTGIGALYAKSTWLEQLPPWQGGGNMIADVTFAKTKYQSYPQKFEAGTQDIAGVVGLGAAVDYLLALGMPAVAAYEHALHDYATQALATVPGLRPVGTAAAKASVLSFVIPGYPSEEIGQHLDRHGIAVRSGHHCAQPSLRRFGLESTVRPSLAFYNTHAEVDALVEALHHLPKK